MSKGITKMIRSDRHHLLAISSLLVLVILLLVWRPSGRIDGGRFRTFVVDADERHPHNGVLSPFKLGDPKVKLNSAALSILRAGSPFQTQFVAANGTASRALVVQDVYAPEKIVWDRILDFDRYVDMVPKTVDSQTYRVEHSPHKQQRIWVRMIVGFFPLLKLQFFLYHLYDPMKKSMTWTLDYARKSDLYDVAGYWYVVPHPDNPENWSRVYHSLEVAVYEWIPSFVVDLMTRRALTDGTTWLKKYSELEVQKHLYHHQQDRQQQGLGIEGTHSAVSPSPQITIVTDSFPPRLLLKRVWSSQSTTGSLDECDASNVSSPKLVSKSNIGLTRYVLVSTTLALALYNIHLYFSQ